MSLETDYKSIRGMISDLDGELIGITFRFSEITGLVGLYKFKSTNTDDDKKLIETLENSLKYYVSFIESLNSALALVENVLSADGKN